ncbi:MAG: diguanylate cyclase [Cyanobacteria bacterium]|nr:diguanylate cyclase [Cyanobacteriota bacterium]
MTTTFPHSQRQRLWIQALVLSLGAVGLNLLRIDVVFGYDLLLGSSLAVFALLLLGDIGLVVGISASLIAWKAWGQPWGELTMLAELLWLRAYLNYFGSVERNHTNGRIVLADITFWIILGIPVIFLIFGLTINLDPTTITLLAIKQALNGIINTTIGFSIFLAFSAWKTNNNPSKAVPIQGLTTAVIMLSVIASSLALATVSSHQLIQAGQQGELERLEMLARVVTATPAKETTRISESLHDSGSLIEFQQTTRSRKDQGFQSNPGLFEALAKDYQPFSAEKIKARGLELLTIKPSSKPTVNQMLNGYWRTSLPKSIDMVEAKDSATNGTIVIVVEPARELIQQILNQSTRLNSMLAWCLLFAALGSEIMAQAVAKQFSLDDLDRPSSSEDKENNYKLAINARDMVAQPALKTTFISDINRLITQINNQNTSIQQLQNKLQNTSLRLRTSREEIDALNTTDALTGCHNRHELYRRLDLELQRSNRDNSELSCVCFEVDHYGRIRDSYGQKMVENVLVEIVNDIQDRARTTDCLCRSGEASFSLILPLCSINAAEALAETFRLAIEGRVIELDGQHISVTLSIGVSSLRTGKDDSESLINRTENALYRAKAEGRNRIVLT